MAAVGEWGIAAALLVVVPFAARDPLDALYGYLLLTPIAALIAAAGVLLWHVAREL